MPPPGLVKLSMCWLGRAGPPSLGDPAARVQRGFPREARSYVRNSRRPCLLPMHSGVYPSHAQNRGLHRRSTNRPRWGARRGQVTTKGSLCTHRRPRCCYQERQMPIKCQNSVGLVPCQTNIFQKGKERRDQEKGRDRRRHQAPGQTGDQRDQELRLSACFSEQRK